MVFVRLFKCERGVTAPLFALLAFTMLVLTLGGIDFIRFHMVHARVQSALDAATLAIGRRLDSSTLETDAQTFFWANVSKDFMSTTIDTPTVSIEGTALTGQTVSMDVTVDFPLLVTSFLDVDLWTFTVHTAAERETTNVELVLAMDNTSSMSNSNKLESMQSAATTLIQTLMGDTTTTSRSGVAIGVVPFTTVVRIPDHPEWLTDIGGDVYSIEYDSDNRYELAKYTTSNSGRGRNNNSSSTKYPIVASTFDLDADWKGCFMENSDNSTDDLDVSPDSDSLSAFYTETITVCTETSSSQSQNGRGQNQSSEETCSATDTRTIIDNTYCTIQEVQFLDADTSKATSSIESMTASGNTAVFTGMLWGWRMLSPDWNSKFSWGSDDYPQDKDNSLTKAVVLLTDGANSASNTQDSTYRGGYPTTLGRDTSSTELNTALSTVCEAAKEDDVVIYTITFGSSASSGTIKELMEDCATGSSYFYNAPSSADLEEAFANIGDSLSRLSLIE